LGAADPKFPEGFVRAPFVDDAGPDEEVGAGAAETGAAAAALAAAISMGEPKLNGAGEKASD
jgi:hypothetical protein